MLYWALMKRPWTIGLTGNIATGKSTVLAYLAARGAAVIDADKLAHRALAPDGAAYAAVLSAFGPAVVGAEGLLDRASLGKIVFADPKRLAELEALVHPAVFVLAQEQLAHVDAPVVVIEAVKLLESGRLLPLCDEIWVVTADESTQLRRLTQQRGMDVAEAHRRMAAQSSPAEKLHLARQQSQRTRLIDNNGSEEALHQQLDRIWDELAFQLETQR